MQGPLPQGRTKKARGGMLALCFTSPCTWCPPQYPPQYLPQYPFQGDAACR
jgi:hypothetical protein